MTVGNNYAFRTALLGEKTENVATRKGIGVKSTILLGIVLVTAIAIIFNLKNIILALGPNVIMGYIIASLVNFILQIIICFSPSATRVLSIPYAISEGILIGVLVGIFELILPGEGIQIAGLALAITVGIFLAASILYTSGLIKVTHKFRAIMFTIMIGILIMSLILSIISIFAYDLVASLYSSPLGITISVILVIVAGVYVVLSLDNANRIATAGVDKKYEWYAAYGITINVVWLFIEVFRLLIILYGKNRN